MRRKPLNFSEKGRKWKRMQLTVLAARQSTLQVPKLHLCHCVLQISYTDPSGVPLLLLLLYLNPSLALSKISSDPSETLSAMSPRFSPLFPALTCETCRARGSITKIAKIAPLGRIRQRPTKSVNRVIPTVRATSSLALYCSTIGVRRRRASSNVNTN